MLRYTDISYVAGMFHYFFFRLKEHKVKSEEEHQEELDVYSKTSQVSTTKENDSLFLPKVDFLTFLQS
jgi:hypothetical protein